MFEHAVHSWIGNLLRLMNYRVLSSPSRANNVVPLSVIPFS